MMDVIEKAKELSMAIIQDERTVKFQVAKAQSETDLELNKMIGEFNLKKMNMSGEYKKTPPDKEKLTALENELKEIYAQIMANEHMAAYTAAKNEVDEMLSHINGIIQLAVSGEIDNSDGCSGSCSGCSGCH